MKENRSTKWDGWGTRGYTVMPHVSPESKRIAETYRLRSTDVVVLSFPKTGTTWTQTVCEQLRTNGEGYEGFGDITERQPWLEFAFDCGQDLDNDQNYGIPPGDSDSLSLQVATTRNPRVFKSHQLLSAINPGGKYLCIVRDPSATLLSWFDFQKAKGRPGYAEYADANDYIAHRPELFGGNHIFGTNLWEMYAELWSARNDPAVKILVYEGLIADAPNRYMDHLPIIADFLDLGNDDDDDDNHGDRNNNHVLYEKVASLVSRSEMIRHVDKFDDHFIAKQGKTLGRALKIMEPAPKVRRKSAAKRTELSEATLEWLEDRWLEKMTPLTGHATYDEFARDLSELLFQAEPSLEEANGSGAGIDATIDIAMEIADSVQTNQPLPRPRKSIIVVRRKSSLVIQEIPGIRERRESLAPHE